MNLVVRGVSAGYGNKVVVSDVDIAFSGVGVHIVIGPNGSGKSTLLRVIAGVLEPFKGDVLIDGVSVFREPEVKRAIGYLPADLCLLPRLTLYENIKLFLELLGFSKNRIEEKMSSLDRLLRISDIPNLRVANMSTGQKARAALARTPAHDPRILILDEPTRGLDIHFARQVRDLLRNVARDRVVIMTTHLMHEVLELGDHVVVMKNGRVIFDSTVAKLRDALANRPVNIYLRTSTEVDEILRGTGLEFAKRGLGDYVVELPSLDYIPKLIKELIQYTSILEFREDIDGLVMSIYEE